MTAIDIATQPRREKTHHPVQEYDGRTIPLPDSSMDVVFSSHVLEHIDPLPPLLAETHRVMRPDALAIHILPSATWRIWTSLAYYPFVLKTLVFGSTQDSLVNLTSRREATNRHGVRGAIWKAIVHPLVAHGSHPNAVAEVWRFSKARWTNVFTQNGFTIINASPNRLFYTGYGVRTELPLATRRRMSSFLGSASHAFVLRKTTSSTKPGGRRIHP